MDMTEMEIENAYGNIIYNLNQLEELLKKPLTLTVNDKTFYGAYRDKLRPVKLRYLINDEMKDTIEKMKDRIKDGTVFTNRDELLENLKILNDRFVFNLSKRKIYIRGHASISFVNYVAEFEYH